MKLVTFTLLQILQVTSWAGCGRETGCRREREEGQGEGGEEGGGEEEEGGGEGGEGEEGGKELMATFDNSVCDPTRCIIIIIITINHIYFSYFLFNLCIVHQISNWLLTFDLKK